MALACSQFALASDVTLDGKNVTPAQINAIAEGATVAIDDNAKKQAEKSFDVLLEAAKTGQKIYGFTVGVGWNKDKTFVNAKGELSPELIKSSIDFNKGLIRAHVGAVGEPLPAETVRAILATRLNMLLTGAPGIQPAYLQTYVDMLNKNVIPVVPSKGSIGQADITVLGHVALNMIGEGEVYYDGKKMPAKDAFEAAGIKIVDPYGKDALAILSTNAYSLALASEAVDELKQLVDMQALIYALSLEAIDGNVSPILKHNVEQKGFEHGIKTAEIVRKHLADSYLWDKSDGRSVQDPLSFRDAQWIMSSLDEAVARAESKLATQINHGDDNPTVAVDVVASDNDNADTFEVKKRYVEGKGALFSASNFDPTPWVLDFEYTTIALAHNANASSQRIIKMNDPRFTNLTRFLGGKNTYHAFGAMEKPFVALTREIQMLANPASVATMSVAGTIEDVATNAPLAVSRLNAAADNYAYILGMELIHAAQAIDLRLQKNPELKLGKDTQKLYKAFREKVAFLDKDRPLSNDFEVAAEFVKHYQP
ncbi:MAG: sugar transporter [Gammaproteobacteria bacterium]|nr:MAG: sugar transporter [Gammaproteobacteria bacterium]